MNANGLWFTARGAGLSAMVMLTIAVGCGAVGSTRFLSASARVLVQYLHRTAAVLGLALILVHVTTLVLDAKSHISLAGALVPFAAQYRPNAVALGSIALYLLLLVSALGVARVPMASSRVGVAVWRSLHLLAYPVWAIAVTHGMLAGTDRRQSWVIMLTVGCVAAVVLASLVRLAALDDGAPDRGSAAGDRLSAVRR